MMQFLCPNGHKIHCSQDKAGQPARCPKCGIRFLIPRPGEMAQAMADGGSDSTDGTPASGVLMGSAGAHDQIEFLCPNNHLLHGPASLQGRPGQCPECGSRFRIPNYNEDVPASADSELGLATSGSSPWLGLDVVHDSGLALGRDGLVNGGASKTIEGTPPAKFADLFARLWPYKSQGATIEIRFGEGHRLVPDRYAKSLSTGTHGVFAVDEPNGTYTLTAIAWDSISVVAVRGAKRLPDDMLS